MPLTVKDLQQISRFYNQLVQQHGIHSPSSLGWVSHITQETRFNVLCQISDLNNCTILDVGCGLGDLYNYLKQRMVGLRYLGVDIAGEMVRGAREKSTNGDFYIASVEDICTESFDYVLSSGTFAVAIGDYQRKYLEIVQQMYRVAKRGVAFNMLNLSDYDPTDIYATHEPEEIESECLKFASNVKIVTGYDEDDFTVYLYK